MEERREVDSVAVGTGRHIFVIDKELVCFVCCWFYLDHAVVKMTSESWVVGERGPFEPRNVGFGGEGVDTTLTIVFPFNVDIGRLKDMQIENDNTVA